MTCLPEGHLTFLLTDIAGSTDLLRREPKAMAEALAMHDAAASAYVNTHRGQLIRHRGEGDSLFAVFRSAGDAVNCARDLQREFSTVKWQTSTPLLVRMALHSGRVQVFGSDYLGLPVNLCARIRSLAFGGQILASEQTISEAGFNSAKRLGEFKLKDFDEAVTLFEIDDGIGGRCFALPSALLIPESIPRYHDAFVGRREEIEKIGKKLTNEGVVLLQGKTGVGKTRLAVAALLESASETERITYCEYGTLFNWSELEGTDVAIVDGIPVGSPAPPKSSCRIIAISDRFASASSPMRLHGLRLPTNHQNRMQDWLRSETGILFLDRLAVCAPSKTREDELPYRLIDALAATKGNPRDIEHLAIAFGADGEEALTKFARVAERKKGYNSHELSPDLEKKLQWLCLSPRAWSFDSAAAIAGLTPADRARLEELGLVELDENYIAPIAEMPIASPASLKAFQRKQESFCFEIAEKIDILCGKGEAEAGLAMGDQEKEHLLAVTFRLQTKDPARFVKLLFLLRRYFARRVDESVVDLYKAACECDLPPSEEQAHVYSGLAYIYWGRGEYARAEEYYLQARDRFQQLGNERDASSMEHNLGIIFCESGDKLRGRTMLQKSFETATRANHEIMVRWSLVNLARVENDLGNYKAAEVAAKQALKSFPDGQVNFTVMGIYQNLGDSYYHQGKIEQAASAMLRAVEGAVATESAAVATVLFTLVIAILVKKGELADAERLIGYSETIADDKNGVPSDRHMLLRTIASLDIKIALPENQRIAYREFGRTMSFSQAARLAIMALLKITS